MLTDDYNKRGHFHHYPLYVHENDDQLPIISQVGRGIKGDSFFVKIKEDSQYFTTLAGLSKDETTGAWTEEWVSENINGGKLMYQYNLRPYTDPQTFTITFRLKRPERDEWAWTTPAIPYIWDADKDGQGDVEGVVGVGVASLFIKKTTEANWNVTDDLTPYTIAQATSRHEKLLYPTGWVRSQLNAPMPGAPYTVNLQYGIGGDIDAPNIDDLAKILGITAQNIRNIVAGQTGQFNGSDNVRDYVDDAKAHIHADMGFGSNSNDSQFPQDGGGSSSGKWIHSVNATKGSTGTSTSNARSVKGYIDEGDEILRNRIKNLEDDLDTATSYIRNLYGLIGAIVDLIPNASLRTDGSGAVGTPNNNTNINGIPSGFGLAVGNINLYSGSDTGNYIIRTHEGTPRDYDIEAV